MNLCIFMYFCKYMFFNFGEAIMQLYKASRTPKQTNTPVFNP